MSKKLYYTTVSLLFASLIACDGGGDANDGNSQNVALPTPTDLEGVSTDNDTGATDSGAVTTLTDTYEAEIFALINDARVAEGLPELELDARITDLALEHNEFLAAQAVASGSSAIQISHENFDDRAAQLFALGYVRVGENVAGQRGFPEDAVSGQFVTGWLNSPEHLANIEGDFTHTGISVFVEPSDNTIYATQLFATTP